MMLRFATFTQRYAGFLQLPALGSVGFCHRDGCIYVPLRMVIGITGGLADVALDFNPNPAAPDGSPIHLW